MNETIALFNRLVMMRVIDPKHFYSISFSCGNINLQGQFNSDIVHHYIKRIKLKSGVSASGFVELQKNKLRFVFT